MDASRWLNAWIVLHSPGFLQTSQFWALCITPIVLATLLLGLRRSRLPLLFGLGLMTLLAARLPLLCLDYLNVDEGFLISLAMRISADPVPYRSADSTTSGPLNLYIFAIPAWFGHVADYASARLTAILLLFGAVAFLWLAIRRFLGYTLATVAVVPVFCFIAYAREADFTHASSEHLPIFLCAAAFYLLVCDHQSGPQASIWRSAAVGVIASAMVFAKLQALLAAAVFLALSIAVAWRKSNRWSSLGALCGGAALAPGIFLWLFVRYGVLQEFWYSYFGRNLTYAGSSGISLTRKFWLAKEMLLYLSNMQWYVLGLAPVWLAGLGACVFFCTRLRSVSDRQAEVRDAAFLTIAAIALAAANFAAIAAPGKPYLHYLLLLLVPFALLTASAVLWVRIVFVTQPRQPAAALAVAIFLVSTCVLPTLISVRMDGARPTAWEKKKFDPSTPLVSTIQRYSSPQEDLVVWGWRSELHVASSRTPGTRFADSVPQLEVSPYLAHFRRIYIADFLKSQPPVFVDAVGPGAFIYTNRVTQGFETFEDLRRAVLQGYRQVGDVDGARVFVRNDRM